MKPIIEITELAKSFYLHDLDRDILGCRNVELKVYPGEFMGITGRSGSGKSTILKLIYRTYLPERGMIWYDSSLYGRMDLSLATERQVIELRKIEIGYVSQFLHVIPRTTARTLVQNAILDRGAGAEEARTETERILTHFELSPDLWDSYPTTFSGGEKLRLNVARAMVKSPRLLLLDEPTASLDEHSKHKVRELIEQLKSKGTTMIGIFHDIEFMNGLCDREHVMHDGVLQHVG